jgi:hypothetical protein
VWEWRAAENGNGGNTPMGLRTTVVAVVGPAAFVLLDAMLPGTSSLNAAAR